MLIRKDIHIPYIKELKSLPSGAMYYIEHPSNEVQNHFVQALIENVMEYEHDAWVLLMYSDLRYVPMSDMLQIRAIVQNGVLSKDTERILLCYTAGEIYALGNILPNEDGTYGSYLFSPIYTEPQALDWGDIYFSITGSPQSLREEETALQREHKQKAAEIAEEIAQLISSGGVEHLRNALGEQIIRTIAESRKTSAGKICVDAKFHIWLSDYNIEIPLYALSKAVYILFLRHPEGINRKQMHFYREELMRIYLTISDREDMERIKQSIDDLVAPYSDSLNQKISRVNAAFRKCLAKDVAKHYMIDGLRGEAKCVLAAREAILPEDLQF